MKPLDKNEIYQNLTGFLKNRGIELKDGSYTKGIEKSCSLLTDAINLGQQGLERAKTEIDRQLDDMRQVIHQKTAPKSRPQPNRSQPGRTAKSSAATSSRLKTSRRKKTKSKKPRG
jgi:hypothetical protein